MKKKGQKLSLDKIKIAKLNNPQMIKGGFFTTHPTTITQPTTTSPLNPTDQCTGGHTMTSTKTIPVGHTENCVFD